MSDTLTTSYPIEEEVDEEFVQYRAVSKGAVISVVLGILSLVALSMPALVVLPLIGLVFGITSFRSIRRYPAELSGKVPAVIGTMLCLGLLVGSVSWHSFVYATEVPDGYQRISFNDLQPQREHPELPVSPKALELDGKKVFVTGYVYPDGRQKDIKQFVMIPDLGTCCFGGQPKLTDMIEVTLEDPLTVRYSMKKRKLAGTLSVNTQLKPVSGLGGVYYQLKADHVK